VRWLGRHEFQVPGHDGVELFGYRLGAGPPLLLSHGFTGSSLDFVDHLVALAQSHTVIAWDHRGHGLSGKPRDEHAYSLEKAAADLGTVADAHGVDRFHLLGHSMGGMIVAAFLEQHAARVDRLILMDTTPNPADLDWTWFEAGAEHVRRGGIAAMLAAEQQARAEGHRAQTAIERWLWEERPGFAQRETARGLAVAPAAFLAFGRAMASAPDRRAVVAAFPRPLLVMCGEHDVRFHSASRDMVEANGNACYIMLRGAAHCPNNDTPEPWRRALLRFLRA